MNNLPQITPASTLGDLPLTDFQVSPATLGEVIAHQFKQRSDLPGALVVDSSRVLGMISRRRFYEQISRSKSRESFLKNPIEEFINGNKSKVRFLQLPNTEKADAAVRMALRRRQEEVYDPIVVVFTDPNFPDFKAFFLVDFYVLIHAQAQLLAFVNLENHKQRTEKRYYVEQIEQEQRKVKEYTKLLENQKKVIQERNLLLETQQLELLEQAREISQFNKRLIKIGRLLSCEGKKAFAATFAGVDAICQNTTQIVQIGRLLSNEIKTIRETSRLIEEVSRQVKHLAVKASIIANHSTVDLSGFSEIVTEISKLIAQTYDAAAKTDRVADSFRSRIEELTESAHTGTSVARSLIGEIELAEQALAQLEDLVQLEKMAVVSTSDEDSIALLDRPESPQSLVKKIAQAETTLSELKKLVERKDPGSLIENIRRTLEKNKQVFSK